MNITYLLSSIKAMTKKGCRELCHFLVYILESSYKFCNVSTDTECANAAECIDQDC